MWKFRLKYIFVTFTFIVLQMIGIAFLILAIAVIYKVYFQ